MKTVKKIQKFGSNPTLAGDSVVLFLFSKKLSPSNDSMKCDLVKKVEPIESTTLSDDSKTQQSREMWKLPDE